MILLQPKYSYEPLNRESVEGKRLYACPDGSKLPSVTTILDKTKSAETIAALANWRKRVGHAKAQEITTEASGRGTRMHKFLEDYVSNGVIAEPGTNPYSQQSHKMAKQIIEKGFSNFKAVYGVEVSLYFPQLYAGTTDGVGVHFEDECIFDHKQTNKPKKEEYIDDYYIQLAAYANAHNEVYKTNIRKGIILMCSADYQYQEFVLKPEMFNYWSDKWWDRVELYYRENG